jgi:hypothetical protein
MCTGAQAIMPAHKLGAGKMVLLGFDNKPGHWATSLRKHYGYPLLPDPEVFDAYAEQFAEIAGLHHRNTTPLHRRTASSLNCRLNCRRTISTL